MALHKDLTGADLHEPKGASTATAGQTIKADGAGSTSWVTPTSLTNIQYGSYLTASRSVNILPASLDTPITAGFDADVSNADISINTSGTITILTAGLYEFTFNFNLGRTVSSGTALIVARLLKNGTQFGFTQGAQLAAVTDSRPIQANLELQLAASDVLQVQVMRDSAGVNEGGFVAVSVTDAGWGDVPSYWVRVRKVLGAA